ncbi:hypothetical protein PHJA_000970400 [Phtheirospermum japonicum]|uniref:Uncharacterized protein n=1 Tax=Phtheirospermum japonicum TaxID=374723 RepID=A0A830BLB8_9LAMI|nr:hypothetical protein PHJA_000970400 [Phtheirospermum japonicum]
MGSTAVTKFLPILAAFLLSAATAHDVSPFCTNATTAPDDKHICTQLVCGAKTWPEAMTNAIKGVIEIANTVKPKVVDCVGANLPSELMPKAKESITSGCRVSFETYVHNLEQCIGFVKHDPTSSLETYLSGSTFFDCKDGLDEFQLSFPEVNHFYHRTIKLANILVSIYNTKPKKTKC